MKELKKTLEQISIATSELARLEQLKIDTETEERTLLETVKEGDEDGLQAIGQLRMRKLSLPVKLRQITAAIEELETHLRGEFDTAAIELSRKASEAHEAFVKKRAQAFRPDFDQDWEAQQAAEALPRARELFAFGFSSYDTHLPAHENARRLLAQSDALEAFLKKLV
jgi:uncharacterized protein (DUF1501 family)